MAEDKKPTKSRESEDKQLSKELEMTFPASDPPSSTQPGGGIAGPPKRKGKSPRANG
jgi:hypothetical protein